MLFPFLTLDTMFACEYWRQCNLLGGEPMPEDERKEYLTWIPPFRFVTIQFDYNLN